MRENPYIEYVFRNVAELSRTRAYNWRTRDCDVVPAVDVWLGGFVCKDKSKLNRNRSQMTDCIQNATGETGITFGFT